MGFNAIAGIQVVVSAILGAPMLVDAALFAAQQRSELFLATYKLLRRRKKDGAWNAPYGDGTPRGACGHAVFVGCTLCRGASSTRQEGGAWNAPWSLVR